MSVKHLYGLLFLLGGLTAVLTKPRGNCPIDWQFIDGVCFQYDEKEVKWTEAEEICRNKYNASMIVIDKQQVYDTIREHVVETGVPYWIGAKRETAHQDYMWVDGRTHLKDTSPFWMKLEPSRSAEPCVLLRKPLRNEVGLNDVMCETNLKFICQRQRHDFLNNYCSVNWRQIGNSCFTFFDDETSYWKAESSCELYGAKLAVSRRNIWSNLTEFANGAEWSFWVGARMTEGDIFKWSDGSTVNDSLWMTGEPNGELEHCVGFDTMTDGRIGFNDVPCRYKQKPICEMKVCQPICNCKRHMCVDTNMAVCIECMDSFQLSIDHRQCQLTQTSASDSALFITGWACAAVFFLVAFIAACVAFSIVRCKPSLQSTLEDHHTVQSLQPPGSQNVNNIADAEMPRGNRAEASVMLVHSQSEYDDCYAEPNMYLELQNQNVVEHVYG